MRKTRTVTICVVQGDIVEYPADVAVFEHAQGGLHGADEIAYNTLAQAGVPVDLPPPNEWSATSTEGLIAPQSVIFIGVDALYLFGYPKIRAFGRTAIEAVEETLPEARSMSLTLHGPGYGLDEIESFNAELAGLIDGLQASIVTDTVTRITIVEYDHLRADRLRDLLAKLLPGGHISLGPSGSTRGLAKVPLEIIRTAGYEASNKTRIFVAMPFTAEMEDVFEFGIKTPINDCGYLCERADLAIFVGDIMDWVKERIATADLVLADLTGMNPNVYLEVGYAWGAGRPTVLIAHHETELKFDVRAQRCLRYKSIKDLNDQITTQLKGLVGHASGSNLQTAGEPSPG